MTTETIGRWQLHFIAHQLPDGRWDPFLTIDLFDLGLGDFKRMLDKQRVLEEPVADYEHAIEAARLLGNHLVKEWQTSIPKGPRISESNRQSG